LLEALGEPAQQTSGIVSVLAAVFSANRIAKRCRDLASNSYGDEDHEAAGYYSHLKRQLYKLKGQTLHYLLLDNHLQVVGHHCFEGDNWAEVLKGGGYCFHRPCETPDTPPEDAEKDGIDAKPKDANEPGLVEAVSSLERFLEGKPEVPVHEWPLKVRDNGARLFRFSYREDDEWDEDYFDDDSDYMDDSN